MTDDTLYLIRNKFTAEGWKVVKRTYDAQGKELSKIETQTQRVGKNYVKASRDTAKANIVTKESMGRVSEGSNDMVKALKRAAIVAPIWLAARAAMMKVLSTVKDIIKTYKELDEGMRKVMAVATWTGETQGKVYADLEARARGYFSSTAKGMKDITEAMYQLGTAGRSTEEIMEGFEHVMNLAVGTFGNVTTSGRIVAGILNVFEKQLIKVGGTSEQLEYISDLLASAWKNNQIELSELNTAMGYLSSVGSALKMSLQELVAASSVMSDALLRGGKGGRLLSRSFVEIIKDSKKLRDLGVIFDPYKPLNFYDVMKQLHEIYEKQAGSMGFVNDLVDVFGVRGVRAVLSVLQQWEKFNKELARTPEEIKGTAKELKELAEGSWGALFKKRWHQIITSPETAKPTGLKKVLASIVQEGDKADKKVTDIGTAFTKLGKTINVTKREAADMIAVLQSKQLYNLAEQLGNQYKINTFWLKQTPNALKEGEKVLERILKQSQAIEAIGLEKHFKITSETETGAIDTANMEREMSRYNSIVGIQGLPEIDITSQEDAIKLLINMANAGKDVSDMSEKNLKAISDLTGKTGEVLEKGLQLRIEELRTTEGMAQATAGLGRLEKQKLDDLKQSIAYEKQREKGVSETSILMHKITNEVNKQNNYIGEYNKKNITSKKDIITIGDVLSQNVEKLKAGGLESIDIDKILALSKQAQVSSFKEQNDMLKIQIEHEEELLKLKGATDSELLEATIQMEKQLGINQSELEILKKKLSLEIAINKEKGQAPEISSEDIKLYKIATEHGVTAARQISEFLQGKISYQAFQYRDAFKIFEEEFGTRAEKEKAAQYFKRGEGRRISLKDDAFRTPDLISEQRIKTSAEKFTIPDFIRKQKMQQLAEERIQIPEVPIVSSQIDFKTTIEKIEVKMPEGTQDNLAESVGKDVIESIKRNSEIAKLLAKIIRPYV